MDPSAAEIEEFKAAGYQVEAIMEWAGVPEEARGALYLHTGMTGATHMRIYARFDATDLQEIMGPPLSPVMVKSIEL